MEKKLKKCYCCLDLPYNATIDEVEAREKAMIKVLNAKENETKISCEKEIEEVQISSKTIVENIKKNGIPKEEYHRFSTSNESLIGWIIIFVLVVVLCVLSFKEFL